MLRILISCFLFSILITSAIASPCTPVIFKKNGNSIILPGSNDRKISQVYFFKNISTQSIWLDHVQKNPGASAGWASYIRPDHWSALALNKKNFEMSCATIQPGKVIYVDCAKSLEICTPTKLISEKSMKGNFWLTEDRPWDQFVKALEKRGLKF